MIIVAAGEGRRFGAEKQEAVLRDRPVVEWSLLAFEQHEEIDEIILVLRNVANEGEYSKRYKKVSAAVKGGEKRRDSVRAGFRCLGLSPGGVVLVHDGVRPLVKKDLISDVIRLTKEKGAAVPVIPVSDTVKRVRENRIMNTEDRAELFRAQTPQGFQYEILKEALTVSDRPVLSGVDEAYLVERIGKQVYVLQGDPVNIKITTPVDLQLAEVLLENDNRFGI